MTTVQVPKFNFTGSSIKTEAEMAVEESKSGGGGKYLAPGRHEVSITEVEYKGLAKDQNWGKFTVTLTGTGDKTTKSFLLVPFRDVMYVGPSGKPTALLYKKFKGFMEALGVTLTVDTLGDVLPTYFGNGGAGLIGKNLAIEIGYEGNYVRYAGKNDDGTKKYNIAFSGGTDLLMDKQLQVINFPDFEAANNYAETHQIKLQKFPEVLAYAPSTVPNVAATVSNW